MPQTTESGAQNSCHQRFDLLRRPPLSWLLAHPEACAHSGAHTSGCSNLPPARQWESQRVEESFGGKRSSVAQRRGLMTATDLRPAPFSPTKAWISAGLTHRSMWRTPTMSINTVSLECSDDHLLGVFLFRQGGTRSPLLPARRRVVHGAFRVPNRSGADVTHSVHPIRHHQSNDDQEHRQADLDR